MDMLLYFALGGGIVLYCGKLYIYRTLTKPFPKFNAWVKRTPIALVALDTFFGFLGMHVISLAGGSVTSMFAMMSYGACGALYICWCTQTCKWEERKMSKAGVTI